MKIQTMTPRPLPPAPSSGDRLETAFLTEMLKIAMPDQSGTPFHGGAGESQFASFLVEQHAAAIAARIDLRLDSRLEVAP